MENTNSMKTVFGLSRDLTLAVALGMCWQPSIAQIPGAGAVNNDDDKFMRTASTGALMEVRMASLVQERGVRPEVRAYGKQMTDAHSAINTGLRELAGRKGVALPSDVDGTQQKTIDELGKLTGTGFDDAFLDAMARAHQKDADEFENAAKNSKDPGVKGFAQKALPAIKAHLARVQALKKGGH